MNIDICGFSILLDDEDVDRGRRIFVYEEGYVHWLEEKLDELWPAE
jgi:hypothetical protein